MDMLASRASMDNMPLPLGITPTENGAAKTGSTSVTTTWTTETAARFVGLQFIN